MFEKHPWGSFVPESANYLLLGSFPGKLEEGNNWFYGSPRNQFWPILENVYGRQLRQKREREELFRQLGMAITDVIKACRREKNSNLDVNLKNIVFNTEDLVDIFENNEIKRTYFTGKFVEYMFARHFRDILSSYPKTEYITLPSPSPRYAILSMKEKAFIYSQLMPRLG